MTAKDEEAYDSVPLLEVVVYPVVEEWLKDPRHILFIHCHHGRNRGAQAALMLRLMSLTSTELGSDGSELGSDGRVSLFEKVLGDVRKTHPNTPAGNPFHFT